MKWYRVSYNRLNHLNLRKGAIWSKDEIFFSAFLAKVYLYLVKLFDGKNIYNEHISEC